MTGNIFFDTNVLVYVYDAREPDKQAKAQKALLDALEHETGTVSTQVLSEFFHVTTRRIPKPLSADEAQGVVNDLAMLEVVEIDLPMINRAIEAHKENHLAYWDALIIAAAERAGCREIMSEDLASGQEYCGVKVVNPFH